MTRRRRPAQELRLAIDCLPHDTKVAMLDGVRSSEIIIGAYTDRDGGVCPMLAAHRSGGRTSYAGFARAWDRYTRAGKRSRKADEREVRTLTTMLEASVLDTGVDLAGAVADHHATKARREQAAADAPPPRRRRLRRDTGERDRTGELRGRAGWAWLRPFRRLDEFEAAVADAQGAESEGGAARERPADLEHV